MELRRAGHVHFIQFIKGESVTKVLNVGRGLPPLKFKALEDICQFDDTELIPTVIRPRFECEDLPIDSLRVNDESTSLLAGGKRVMCEHEKSESDSSDDDLLLDSMTLTQMLERYKVKKRKCSSKDSPGKKTHLYSRNMEEDCELMESLSSLKSKLSKNRKFKRKSRIINSLFSSQTALSVVKTEVIPIGEAISQSSGSTPLPVSIKIEIPDPIESSWDNVMPISTESSCCDFVSTSASTSSEEPNPVDENSECILSIVPWEDPDGRSDCGFENAPSAFCDEHVKCVNEKGIAYREQQYNDFILYERFLDETYSEDAVTANVCDLGSHVSPSVSNELKLIIVTEESNDMKLHNCKSNADELASEEEMMMVDEAPTKYSKTANAYGLNPHSSILSNELQVCVVNKATYEYWENSDPKSVHSAKDSDGESMVPMAEQLGNQMPDLCLSGSKEEDSFVDPHLSENYAETVSSSEGHISDTYNDSQSSISSLEKLCETDIIITNSIHSIELSNRDDSPLSEMGAKDGESRVDVSVATQLVGDCSSFDSSNSQSSIADSAVSAIDYSLMYEGKQSVESASSTLEAKESSSELKSRIGEPVAEEQKHPPERLLSSRKAISPASQKRLCEAMEFTKLDDEQYYKHTRKLCYQKLTENKISRPEKVSPVKKCETAASCKARTEKNVLLNKGILKDPSIPRSVPRYSTGCMSLESCSESAILFSQQQMRDVQSIANKLSRELKSLKDIVEETLGPNVNPAAPLKYSTEEVGIAIRSATRVEENAKRLLSIMARDCNRFCKIMKLTDKGPATSRNVACKEKRKIVFADEAGGQLCDVKTFKHDLASPVDSIIDGEKIGTVD